jgi:hypothetical protein
MNKIKHSSAQCVYICENSQLRRNGRVEADEHFEGARLGDHHSSISRMVVEHRPGRDDVPHRLLGDVLRAQLVHILNHVLASVVVRRRLGDEESQSGRSVNKCEAG